MDLSKFLEQSHANRLSLAVRKDMCFSLPKTISVIYVMEIEVTGAVLSDRKRRFYYNNNFTIPTDARLVSGQLIINHYVQCQILSLMCKAL